MSTSETQRFENLAWETATGKPRMDNFVLAGASAHLSSNVTGGLMVALDPGEGKPLENTLRPLFEHLKEEWGKVSNEKREELLNMYELQFKSFIPPKQGIDPDTAAKMIVGMMVLVSAGRVVNDESNGAQFIWRLDMGATQ